MSKKGAYNLNFLAKSVFELDGDDQKILRILASQTEYTKGINQTQITRYFNNTDRIDNRKTIMRKNKKITITRKTIKKKLFGTNKTIGLIPNEYVIPKKEQKKRYGKDEITFHLTFKGLFGALASGVSLKRIYIYRKFLKAVDLYVKDKKINKIIKKFYELQIHAFLLWHYVYGIQLKNMTMFQIYYSEVNEKEFNHADFFGVRIHPNIIKVSHNKEKISEEFNLRNATKERGREGIFVTEIMNVFSSYFTYKGIINVLRINGIIPTAHDLLKPDIDSIDSDEALDFDRLIDYWLNYIEGVYLAESPSDILYGDSYVMPNQYNITFLPQGFRYEIEKHKKEDAEAEIEKAKGKKGKEPKLKKTLEKIDGVEKMQDIVYIPSVTDKIRGILEENEFEIEIPESVKRSIDKYPF